MTRPYSAYDSDLDDWFAANPEPTYVTDECEESPTESGRHVVSIGRSGKCIFCKREVES